ncbi:hypothetical protein V2J09_001052 [Rumex salicifolius]
MGLEGLISCIEQGTKLECNEIILMDQQVNSADQLPYGGAYPSNQVTAPISIGGVHPGGAPSAGNELAHNMLAYQQIQQQQQQQLQEQLQNFWANQHRDIEKVCDFKNHSLPLARIKKIMKADEDVRMISAEAPIVFARACEMFILELTLRSWGHTEENKRRTLQKNDIAAAITRTDIFDFLVDIVPREDVKDDILLTAIPRGGNVPVAGPTDALPYYYSPQDCAGGAGMMMGQPVMDPNAYAQPGLPYMAQAMWPPQKQPSPSDN